ncbi:methionine ABC transporter substrate-binding protein, partial [Pseudomonas syringae pv. tagetis]
AHTDAIEKLSNALTSQQVKDYINMKYEGAVLPAL